jgi:hypothetical protein
MFQRILGVFRLNVQTFEEIEHDQGATMQAAIIVAVVALLSGFGGGMFASMQEKSFFGGFIGAVISAFVGWLVWAVVTWFVGTKFFGGQADIGEMLRVIGFAQAPKVLGIIPCVGGVIGWVWALVAGFVAIRQGLDLDNTKTFFTIVIGFIVAVVVDLVLGFFTGGMRALFT